MGRDNKEKIKLYKKIVQNLKKYEIDKKKQIRIYWYCSH